METKILTLCIASYNMEAYLPRCLDSMLLAEVLASLEVIIVNDGSTDRTLEVALRYQSAYPGTVVVIDQPNGHYGSCINASLRVARGRYFRTVDADDWVDADGLRRFIQVLREHEADCFMTRFATHHLQSGHTSTRGIRGVPHHQVLPVDDLPLDASHIMMYSLTWRLSLLHDIDYRQTEGICYTDQEYAYLPLMSAQTVFVTDLLLYHYLLGREGQSVAPDELMRNSSHYRTLYDRFVAYRPPLVNRQAEQIRRLGCQNLLTELFLYHILYGYRDAARDAHYRQLLDGLLAQGKDYPDLFVPGGMRIRFIQMWHRPTLCGRLLLALRRRL